jgi:hypothetical protein
MLRAIARWLERWLGLAPASPPPDPPRPTRKWRRRRRRVRPLSDRELGFRRMRQRRRALEREIEQRSNAGDNSGCSGQTTTFFMEPSLRLPHQRQRRNGEPLARSPATRL